jgi:drug/metabolite transporter (DMT)-like permease
MARGRFQEAARLWNNKRGTVFTIGALDFTTYLLVLWAYSLASNVAYVAAMRQFSTVLGVLGGILFLKEPGGLVRIFGSVIIVCGLALIALGR